MYRQSFGSTGQVQFANEHEYYRLLGYLAKSDGSTDLPCVNCNSFVENLYTDHHYVQGIRQNIPQILTTIPFQFINDFNDGLNL